MQCKLIGDVEDETELAGVREVEGSDTIGESNVQLLVGKKGKVLCRQVGVGELRQEAPRERSHDTDGSVG